jgi:hypothetical protein
LIKSEALASRVMAVAPADNLDDESYFTNGCVAYVGS